MKPAAIFKVRRRANDCIGQWIPRTFASDSWVIRENLKFGTRQATRTHTHHLSLASKRHHVIKNFRICTILPAHYTNPHTLTDRSDHLAPLLLQFSTLTLQLREARAATFYSLVVCASPSFRVFHRLVVYHCFPHSTPKLFFFHSLFSTERAVCWVIVPCRASALLLYFSFFFFAGSGGLLKRCFRSSLPFSFCLASFLVWVQTCDVVLWQRSCAALPVIATHAHTGHWRSPRKQRTRFIFIFPIATIFVLLLTASIDN